MKSQSWIRLRLVYAVSMTFVAVFICSQCKNVKSTTGEAFTYTTATAPAVNGWIPIGPGGGGTIFLPVISPHNKDVMMTLCDMSGSYLSKDGGNSWTTLYFKGVIDTYCFDPVDPDVIYVGSRQSGLWKTADGGDSWFNIQPVFDTAGRVVRIAVDPADNRIIYVGTINNAFHVSYDGGVTFEFDVFPPQTMRVGDYHGGYRFSGPGAGAFKDVTTMLHVDPESPLDARVIYTFNRNFLEDGKITTAGSINRIERTGSGRRDYHISYIKPPIPTNICGIDWVYDPDAPAGRKTTYYVTMASEAVSLPAASEPWFPNQFNDPANDMYDGSVWMTHNLSDPVSYTLIADNNTEVLRKIFRQYNRHPEDHLTLTRMRAANNQVFILQVYSYGHGNVSGINQYGYLRSTDGGQSWEWLVFKEEDELVYPDADRCPPSWLDYHFGYEYPGASWGIATTKLPPGADDPSAVRIFMLDQGQIHISDNGGYSWRHGHSKTTTGADGYVYGATTGIQVTSTYDISFDPFDADHIVISKTDVGQLVSRDGGRNWRPNEEGLMPEPYGWREYNKFKKDHPGYHRYWTNTCYKTVFDPDVKDKVWSIWSGHHDMPRLPYPRSEFITPGCVAVSDNGGRRWAKQGGYLVPATQSGLPELTTVFTDLLIDPRSDPENRTLYTATMGHGVYKSTDGGLTWQQKVNGIEPLAGLSQAHIDDGLLYCAWKLMMTPDGALYVTMYKPPSSPTTNLLYVSHDGAETWEKLTMPNGASFIWGMDYDSFDPTYTTLYVSVDNRRENPVGGIYKSVDGGHHWKLILGNTTPDINGRGILTDRFVPRTVYASSLNGQLKRSDDAGETWSDLDLKLQWHECLLQNPHEPDRLYVVTHGLGVWYGPARSEK